MIRLSYSKQVRDIKYVCIFIPTHSKYNTLRALPLHQPVWLLRCGAIPGREQNIELTSKASKMALGTTQSPIQWVLWALSLGVKWLENVADHLPPLAPKLKMSGAAPPLFRMPSWKRQGKLHLHLFRKQSGTEQKCIIYRHSIYVRVNTSCNKFLKKFDSSVYF
jgi:hypothetical protein